MILLLNHNIPRPSLILKLPRLQITRPRLGEYLSANGRRIDFRHVAAGIVLRYLSWETVFAFQGWVFPWVLDDEMSSAVGAACPVGLLDFLIAEGLATGGKLRAYILRVI